jgi:hypothetical protein
VAGVQPGDLPDLRVDGDELVAAAAGLLLLAGALEVFRVQGLVADEDSKPGDLLVPR